MRIRPTALGCKGLLLLLTLELAFLATAYSNLFFLLLAFSVALGALAALWTAANLRGLRVARLDVPMAAAGAPREVQCQLAATKPRCDLTVELVLAEAVLPVGQLALAGATRPLAGTLPGRPRGVTTVHAVRVSSRFPLGLFVARRDLPATAAIVTHPAPLPHGARGADAGDGSGDDDAHGVRGATTAALRPFRSGDATTDVHWKATARRGEPVVKERERDSDRGTVFVLDRRCSPAALEQALATIATAALVHDSGLVRVHSQGAALAAHGGSGRDELLRWLAAATPLPADAPPPPTAPGRPRRLPAGAQREVLA